jgi:O-6-methylguanine DNA methyltransferase
METLLYHRTPSPAGPLFLAASPKGLVRLEFEARIQKLNPNKFQLDESAPAIAPYLRELNEYFAGHLRDFSFPLDLRGTDFQLACWHALLKIPYGETRSYLDIARAIRHPLACRAVGMANNKNPIAIVVPCHRVIASSGSLCGYGGGLDLKRQLLDLEQSNFQSLTIQRNERDQRTNNIRRQQHTQPCLPLRVGA